MWTGWSRLSRGSLTSELLPLATGSFAIALIAYAFGRTFALRADNQRRREMCAQLYDVAVAQRAASKPMEAAVTAAEAAGYVSRHECHSVIAQAFDDIDCPQPASEYWSRARAAARQQANGEQAYYYYREARSFLRAQNAEFAYLRSEAAIELIELGHIQPTIDGRDYVQYLRAVRMISSLQHLKGTEAWNAAMADAVWLQRNATDKTLADLGASVGGAHLAGEITADMIDKI